MRDSVRDRTVKNATPLNTAINRTHPAVSLVTQVAAQPSELRNARLRRSHCKQRCNTPIPRKWRLTSGFKRILIQIQFNIQKMFCSFEQYLSCASSWAACCRGHGPPPSALRRMDSLYRACEELATLGFQRDRRPYVLGCVRAGGRVGGNEYSSLASCRRSSSASHTFGRSEVQLASVVIL